MTGGHPCPNRNCKNYGYQCWDHCNHCGKDILWKPKGMDFGVKYTGPKPLNPIDGKKHECMRGGTKDGNWYHTPTRAEEREEDNWNKLKGYTGPPPPPGIHLGTTHLWVNNEFVRLYKCPLCSFQNIHRDIINHHLKFAYDSYHNQSGITI